MPLSLQSVKNLAALIYGRQIRVLSGGSICVQAQPAGRQRDQGSLRCLSYACVAWPPRQQVEPGPARPLPLQTRSRGSVLRGMHSWQASFWWVLGDGLVSTEPRDWQVTTASGEAQTERRKALRLSKNPGELERAAALSNFQSCPAACTAGTGRFLRRKIPFSREKSVSLQAPRPKNLRFLAETGEGGSGGGACSPVHQLVKTFLTS